MITGGQVGVFVFSFSISLLTLGGGFYTFLVSAMDGVGLVIKDSKFLPGAYSVSYLKLLASHQGSVQVWENLKYIG